MGKITRHEFPGSRMKVWLLCLTLIGIPLAVLDVLECTATIEEEVESPTEFLATHSRRA